MKRFYKTAQAKPEGENWQVVLDGRPIKTPRKQPFAFTEKLARAVAEEWLNQSETIDLESMVLYRLAVSAIDFVGIERDEIIQELLGYGDTDLLCYLSSDAALKKQQLALYAPMLRWAEAAYGVKLKQTDAVLPVTQPEENVALYKAALEKLDDAHLAALNGATRTSGSLIVGLALLRGALSPEQAFAIARFDETEQAKQWGTTEVLEAQNKKIRKELQKIAEFINLLD